MAQKLRDQILGAWKLVSFVEKPTDGSAPNHPMGEKPIGIIMYTADGYMSAQLMRSERAAFASGDWSKATLEEYAGAASTYFAYAGPFHIDEERKTITHSVSMSIFPNWIGGEQHRTIRIEGDILHLSTASPIQLGGRSVNAQLQWKRCAKKPDTGR
jgi:hypothetical protein